MLSIGDSMHSVSFNKNMLSTEDFNKTCYLLKIACILYCYYSNNMLSTEVSIFIKILMTLIQRDEEVSLGDMNNTEKRTSHRYCVMRIKETKTCIKVQKGQWLDKSEL